MSSFSRGIGDMASLVALADEMQRRQAYQQLQQQEMEMRRRAEARQIEEGNRRRRQDDASRAVWIDAIDRLGGFGAQGGVGPAGLPGSAPTPGTHGPFTPDQQMAQTFAAPEMPGMLGMLSRESLAGASPGTLQEIAGVMIGERDRARQNQARADLDYHEWYRGELEKRMRRQNIVSEMTRIGADQEDIQRTLMVLNLSESLPAGALSAVTEQIFPGQQDPTASWDMGRALGYDPAMQGAFEQGAFSPEEAWRMRPKPEQAAPDPESIVSAFGPDLGAKVMQFTQLRGLGMSPTDAWATVGDDGGKDLEAAAGIAKRQTQMAQERVRQIQQSISALYPLGVEGVDAPETAALQQAQQEYQRAAEQERDLLALMGERLMGGGTPATPAAPVVPAAPTGPAPTGDTASIVRQVAGQLFPGVAPERLTPQQKQQIADRMTQLSGGGAAQSGAPATLAPARGAPFIEAADDPMRMAPRPATPGNVDPTHVDAYVTGDTVNAPPLVLVDTGNGVALVSAMGTRGEVLSADDAAQRFERDGRHLGVFRSPEEAQRYAEMLAHQGFNRLRQGGTP